MAITNTTADPQAEPESTAQDGSTNALDSQTPKEEQPTTTTITSVEADRQATTTTTSNEEPGPLTQDPEPDVKSTTEKWPGWPGDCVFRLIVPVTKVGSIIGRKGDLIKKLCDDTRARVRILDGPPNTPDRVVLISGKEEPEAPLSAAMDAAIRIFKHVSGLPEGDAEVSAAAGIAFCSIRLLVASTQAISLIGKQGSIIKSIQEKTKASVRIMSEAVVRCLQIKASNTQVFVVPEETPFYVAADERIVDFHGEALNVLKALEAVVGHLRKFLVDHSVLPLFEKNYNAKIPQDRQVETWADKSVLHPNSQGMGDHYLEKREALFFERETQIESQLTPTYPSIRSSAISRAVGPIITQITQTMQVPISYAEEIIGVQGDNISYIRKSSGATISVKESVRLPDQIIVEINGTSLQVQTAQQLIQDILSNASHKESVTRSYDKYESGLRSMYTDDTYYPSSSVAGQLYDDYGSSGIGDYGSYRI
ncbi:unnamed protein product [Dovyalis caffra]|uniref:K Homology domain-containing protein n=1 Tax=Dovyalis caffra TaxID=77055 RepID=A0AAV1S5P6_9ROSI|nr:unnamed protein product [Dovyalis caffra]